MKTFLLWFTLTAVLIGGASVLGVGVLVGLIMLVASSLGGGSTDFAWQTENTDVVIRAAAQRLLRSISHRKAAHPRP